MMTFVRMTSIVTEPCCHVHPDGCHLGELLLQAMAAETIVHADRRPYLTLALLPMLKYFALWETQRVRLQPAINREHKQCLVSSLLLHAKKKGFL